MFRVCYFQGLSPLPSLGCSTAPSYVPSYPARTPHLPCEEPHTEAGKECEEEEAAERTCDELTAMPIPCPAVLVGGEEVEKLGVKLGQ